MCNPLDMHIQDISNNIRNSSIQCDLSPTITFRRFEGPLRLQHPKWKFIWEYAVQTFTLSYIAGSMKCDSQASFLANTFARPCFGHKPKDKVVTLIAYDQINNTNGSCKAHAQ